MMAQEDQGLHVLRGGFRRAVNPFLSPTERARPAYIRRALIGTLFGRASNVAMLAVAATVCGWLAYERNGYWPSVLIAGLEVAAIVARCCVIIAHQRAARLDAQHPETWLAAFGWLALASSILWGSLCFLSFATARDPVLYVIPVLSTVGIAGSIAARNSAVPRLAKAQLACSLLPIVAGCLMADDHGFRTLLVLVPAMATGLVILINERNGQLVKLMEVQHELDRLSKVDALTNIANRRTFDEAILALSQARRPFALLMIDVDHFKRFNDRYGHPAGDNVLRRVAAILQAELRSPSDLVARYGGEEFAILIEGADRRTACLTAERLRDRVSLTFSGSAQGSITISVGVCSNEMRHKADEIVQLADDALYRAKRSGRNRAIHADQPTIAFRRTAEA